ncbi:hypothetical protein EK599_07340 [Vibrio sp. T187]|uniref:EamA family transporter n=1 Tax=Vibrio TaxID=662 RepID=UPI0010C9E349|nr:MULTISPECIES: EamA family transporter [Vibrio]MBW3695504.1 hypothetical protein [Vibrio sp. T187]
MIGISFIVASVTLQAFVLSKVSYQFSSAEVMTFSALSFFLCSLLFGLKLQLKGKVKITKEKARCIATLNVHTLLAFGAFHLALIFLPASSAALFETSIALLVVAILTKESQNRILQTILIIAFTLGFVFAANVLNTDLMQGILLAALAGVGAATISVRSNRENSNVLSTDEALAYRFVLSALATFSFLYMFDSGMQVPVSYFEVVLLSLFGFVAPFFLLQKGMEVTKPALTISLLSIIPVISYFFESIFYSSPSLIEMVLITSAILLIVLYSIRGFIKQTKATSTAESCEQQSV